MVHHSNHFLCATLATHESLKSPHILSCGQEIVLRLHAGTQASVAFLMIASFVETVAAITACEEVDDKW
jgi:hypothetical protein